VRVVCHTAVDYITVIVYYCIVVVVVVVVNVPKRIYRVVGNWGGAFDVRADGTGAGAGAGRCDQRIHSALHAESHVQLLHPLDDRDEHEVLQHVARVRRFPAVGAEVVLRQP